MAVNARTYQILYIVRQRAQNDKKTTFDDFANFIAERRLSAPGAYSRAYINPGNMASNVHRMTTGDGLLTIDTVYRTYQLTALGSQMADLLVDIDACSDHFIENYKMLVCGGVLQQRRRLGWMGGVCTREVAANANISLDSARRGLTDLEESARSTGDKVHLTFQDRNYYYSLLKPAPVPEVDDAPIAVDEDPVKGTPVIDDDGSDPAALAEGNVVAAEDDEEDPIKAALAEINEDDSVPILPHTRWQPDDPDLSLEGIIDDDIIDDFDGKGDEADPGDSKRECGADNCADCLGDESCNCGDCDEDDHDDCGAPSDYRWESVSPEVREGLIIQAKAAGVTLDDFFNILGCVHQQKIREALFADVALIDPPDRD